MTPRYALHNVCGCCSTKTIPRSFRRVKNCEICDRSKSNHDMKAEGRSCNNSGSCEITRSRALKTRATCICETNRSNHEMQARSLKFLHVLMYDHSARVLLGAVPSGILQMDQSKEMVKRMSKLMSAYRSLLAICYRDCLLQALFRHETSRQR